MEAYILGPYDNLRPSVGHELKCGCRSKALWKTNLISDPHYKVAYALWALYAFDYELEKNLGDFVFYRTVRSVPCLLRCPTCDREAGDSRFTVSHN